MELSKTQAANIENKQSPRNRQNNANSSQDGVQFTRSHVPGSHATVVTKTGSQAQSAEIVAKITPILEEKHRAPHIKLNHFEAVCKSKDKGESRNTRRPTVNKVK